MAQLPSQKMDKLAAAPKSPPLDRPEQTPLHQDDATDEDDTVKQLRECSALYLSLQDCLIKSDRNWKTCQTEVQALKACNERRMNSKDK